MAENQEYDDNNQQDADDAAPVAGGSDGLSPVKLKGLHIAPRKVRVVVDQIRGKGVAEAMNLLTFTPRGAAEPVRKLLDSAIANARQQAQIDIDALFVATVFVDQAQMMKRWTPRAQGRATRILKKTSHVTLQLGVL